MPCYHIQEPSLTAGLFRFRAEPGW